MHRDASAGLAELIAALPAARLRTVFTHTSWAAERAESYERLEFLGDSVLGLAVAEELFRRFPDESEGRLAKIRSHVVSRQSCALVARDLGLDTMLRELAVGAVDPDELERLARNRNVLAALIEAVLAALYLELGFEAIQAGIVAAFEQAISFAITDRVDNKTELQEELARRGLQVSYLVVEAEGPPHERRFTCVALVDGEELGRGTDVSKKAAEQLAAGEALERLLPPA